MLKTSWQRLGQVSTGSRLRLWVCGIPVPLSVVRIWADTSVGWCGVCVVVRAVKLVCFPSSEARARSC
eukprot:5194511-Amphidinium_carterae.2